MADLIPVSFHDHKILTHQVNGVVYVMMRPIVEAFGLSWSSQLNRIKSHPALGSSVLIINTVINHKTREVIFLPLHNFHAWLVTLNPNKIPDENRRELIIRYQKESFQAVHDYWHEGQAINPRMDYSGTNTQDLELLATSGLRFKQERERLGFSTRSEFSKASGIKGNILSRFENLHLTTKNLHHIFILTDMGFDYRYWMTGMRTSHSPVSPQESKLLQAWRYSDQRDKQKMLSDLSLDKLFHA